VSPGARPVNEPAPRMRVTDAATSFFRFSITPSFLSHTIHFRVDFVLASSLNLSGSGGFLAALSRKLLREFWAEARYSFGFPFTPS